MPANALVIDNLEFSYENTPILRDVCFSIQKGEFIGIFGPNGGGKTTLLKLILGLLKPRRGNISLLGAEPKKTRHRVGYVPQTTLFDRDFPITTLEVVMQGYLKELNAWGSYPKKTRLLAQKALHHVGLQEKEKAPFGSLSGGQLQRALIARAIISSPEILILDEPTANIDPEGEHSIQQLLAELNKEMTLLMVTHDLQGILDHTKRLLCVQGNVKSLYSSEICEHFALGLYHTPLGSQHKPNREGALLS